MRAACLVDNHRDLVITDVRIDQPAPREVLVRTAAVGVCHSDLHLLDGTLQRPRPMVLGHEAAGVVEAVGSAVTDFAVGDHVVTCLVVPCGECRRCLAGEQHLCANTAATRRPAGDAPRIANGAQAVGQMAAVGALAERMLVHEHALTTVPADMPLHLAALLGCAVVTGLGSVLNVAQVQPGQSVAVIGCGGIGLAIVQGARIAGASTIIAVDVSAEKLTLAGKLGATHVVNAAGFDPVAEVLAHCHGGVDHAFEAIGRPATVQQALAMVAAGRSAYVVGLLPDGGAVTVGADTLRAAKRLEGVFMGSTQPRRDIPAYVKYWRDGALDLQSMVSATLTLDQVNEGFAALAEGRVARAVVVFEP